MSKKQVADLLKDLEASLATVRLDLQNPNGIFETSDLPMVAESVRESLEHNAKVLEQLTVKRFNAKIAV